MMSSNSFSAAFWDILEHTTGIKPKNRKKPPKMSRLNRIVTHRISSSDMVIDANEKEYLEKEITMSHNELATAALDISAFNARLNIGEKSKKETKGSLDWSEEAPKLVRLAADELRLGRKGNINSEEFLRGFFKSLQLKSMKISRIDPLCAKFTNLEELNLSQNKISILENLPSRLRVLNAYANKLSHVGLNSVFPNLIYAGLGYNQLSSMTQLDSLAKGFPRLRILEMSFNTICDLEGVLECLRGLRQLTHLSLVGNPVTLIQHYRSHVLRALTSLEELDDIDTEGHFSLIQTTPGDTIASTVVFRFQIKQFSFDDDGDGTKKKKKAAKPKPAPKKKPAKGKGKDKGKGKGKDKGKGKGKDKDKGKGKGKDKGKKKGKGKKGKEKEPELPETQYLYFVRFELPGVTDGKVQTPAIVEQDGSWSFSEPLVLELPPSAELRDCVYFEGITVSFWSQVKTQPPKPEVDSDEEDEDAEPPPTPAPIISAPKFEGKFVFKVSELLNPKWNFDRVTAKPEATDPEEPVEESDKPEPKPINPIRLQQRSQLSRPASREKAPEVEDGEEEPPRDGAPPGPVFLDIELEVGEMPVVEPPASADADAGEEDS